MPFDFSANFAYTGSSQTWTKPKNISTVIFEVYSGGGGGSAIASGGGGAFVFAKYIFLNPDISYNVTIDVGSGGKAPPLLTGGTSVGGNPANSNGGNGTTSAGLSSGSGGGMTNIIYDDPSNNRIIKIIAGGGGGGGSINSGGAGGASSQIGTTGSGLGGGQGGNTSLTGNAGLGGISGGVNGHNYLDSSGAYLFIGGGGGGGGSFAGGGGGAGYGGGAGGNKGGGGGGGSFTNGNIVSFSPVGGGGAGGLPGQNGINGSVIIYWNSVTPIIPLPIVPMLMLNAQHTSRSIYKAPATAPAIVNSLPMTIASGVINNQNAAAIGVDGEIYIVDKNGVLYAFNHDFTNRWNYALPSGSSFFGTPAISISGTLYLSSTAATFYAIFDAGPGLMIIKWTYTTDSAITTSLTLDLSGNIFFGTQNGTIYALTDNNSSAVLGWKYPVIPPNVPIVGAPAFDLSYNKLSYTDNSNIYTLDVSNNSVAGNIVPTQRWTNANAGGTYTTPSIYNNRVYAGTSSGYIYAYDISNNGNEVWNVDVLDISLSAIAIGSNNRVYCTSTNSLNVIDSSNGVLEWTYPIDGAVINNSIPLIDISQNIYFGGGNKIISVNASQRVYNWHYDINSAVGTPVLGANGQIYVQAQDGYIYDLSGNTSAPSSTPIVQMYMLNPKHTGLSSNYGPTTANAPSILWQAPFVSGNLFVSPSISIANDGTLYLGSNDGYIYALYRQTGIQKWNTLVSNSNDYINYNFPNSIFTTPVISHDSKTVYVGSNRGYLYALDASGGSIKWSYNAGYPLQSSPMMDSVGSIYFGAGNKVYSIGDADTAPYDKWLTPFVTGGNVNSSPALSTTHGLIYFGSDDGYIYAADSFTGVQQWASVFPVLHDNPIYTSAAVDASDNVLIGNGSYMNGVLYYLDGLTGSFIWQFPPAPLNPADKGGPYYNTVAIKGDTVYLGAIAYVYALNRQTGVLKWKYFNMNCYHTSPIIDASGTLLFASIQVNDSPIQGFLKNDGILLSLTDTGATFSENWALKVCSNGRLAPPVIDDAQTIYISSTANKIYAII